MRYAPNRSALAVSLLLISWHAQIATAAPPEITIHAGQSLDRYCSVQPSFVEEYNAMLVGFAAGSAKAANIAMECFLNRWSDPDVTLIPSTVTGLLGMLKIDPELFLTRMGTHEDILKQWLVDLPQDAFEWDETDGPCPHKREIALLRKVVAVTPAFGPALKAKSMILHAFDIMKCHFTH